MWKIEIDSGTCWHRENELCHRISSWAICSEEVCPLKLTHPAPQEVERLVDELMQAVYMKAQHSFKGNYDETDRWREIGLAKRAALLRAIGGE